MHDEVEHSDDGHGATVHPTVGAVTDAALAEAVRQHSEGFVLLDEDWTIVFANTSSVVVGWEVEDLVGRSAFDVVAPDDLERAALSIAAVHGTDRPSPGLINLVGADGVTREFEASPGAITLADGRKYTFVTLHDDHLNQAHWQAMAALVAGASVGESLRMLAEGATHPIDGPMIIAFDDGGRREVVGALPPELGGVVDGRADERPDSPFGRALAEGTVTVAGRASLPEDLRAVADAHGLADVVIVPVEDPAEPHPALIVQWPPSADMGNLLSTALARRPRQLVTLALRQRDQLRRLEWSAWHDGLTGLPNRGRFFDALDQASAGDGGLVGYVDLDGFKDVNDTHGHVLGDAVLVECARRLRLTTRTGDLVARLGGDEFALLYPGLAGDADTERLGGRLIDCLGGLWSVGGHELALGASVGLAPLAPGANPDEAVAAADRALYEAKRAGKGHWRAAP